MTVFSYLPSSQFSLIVGSVALSGALVVAAQHVTSTPSFAPTLSITSSSALGSPNWMETLNLIQGQNPLGNLPPEPDPNAVENLLGAAKSENLTNTVARSLFVNLSSAKAQGLGSDVPTQEELIAAANAEIAKNQGEGGVSSADLEIIPVTPLALKAYGNTVMSTLTFHPKASYADTLLTISAIIDSGDASKARELEAIGNEYALIAQELREAPTPQTLVPLHLKIVNNFGLIAQTYKDMALLATDPLRALSGLERYQTLIGETDRVFTNIAQELGRNSILFNKDEPGDAWSLFLLQ